jgi:Matrixin
MQIRNPPVLLTLASLLLLSLPGVRMQAYTTYGAKWANPIVTYYVNSANQDNLPGATAETAVRAGADVWAAQSSANFRFSFAGSSTQSTWTYDGINLVVFRNESRDSAIATTYTWVNSSGILDADIVFWDAGFHFYAGTSGCSGGFYIEDVGAHEFGHALGLDHSTVAGATMYPSISTCSSGARTLDADDIAGVVSLYPSSNLPGAPTGFRIIRP